ncbi:MAG: hypothetical protein LAN59_13300 [Acidobacteriia bacterium]|nr:hypothetical protein [Terriglobia bacterium]
MTKLRKSHAGLLSFSWFAFTLVLLMALPASAQQKTASAKVPVTTVVAVLGPSFTAPPAVSKEDVIVHTGSVREDVTGWVAAQGERAALDLAILIDDVTDTSVGNQFDDLRKFIRSQSKSTRVGIFYANEGRAQEVSAFSADHDAVSKKLRITFGQASASTSLYFSLMDLMSKWPASTARREILVIGDGIDRFRGDPFSSDVTLTIEKAQKAGILIHTLYARGAGRAARNLFRTNYGQSNLAQMTDATGGESFFQGLETPISFAPFLDQLDMVLHNQYFLTFTTTRSGKHKGELRGFRVTTEQRHAEIAAPREIFVPGP